MDNMIPMLTNFYHSTFFSVVKFLIGVYTVVLFVDIVLLLIQRGLAGDIRDIRLGINIPKEMVKKGPREKLKKRWLTIRQKLETGDQAQFKLAILEADDVIADLVRRMGFAGQNLAESLDAAKVGQVGAEDNLRRAHNIRNRIIHEETFVLTEEQAKETLADYEEFLVFHGVIE